MKRAESSAHDPSPPGGGAESSPPTGNEAGRYAVDWAHRAGAVDELVQALEFRAKGRRRRRVGLAIGTAVAFALAIVQWPLGGPPPRVESSPNSIVLASPARHVLADGSVVDLQDGAIATVNITSAVRKVRLQRGVAHFAVAKDETKPFVVQAGRLNVRAV